MRKRKELQDRLALLSAENERRVETLKDESITVNPVQMLTEINAAEAEMKQISDELAALDALEAKAKAHAGRQAARVHNLAEDRPWGNGPVGPLAEFLGAVRQAEKKHVSPDPRLHQLASGMNEEVGSEGGFLVPVDMENDLRERGVYVSEIASRCSRRPLTGNALDINGIDETSRANGSRFGGVRAYWQGEAVAATATKPGIDQVKLKLKKLTAMVYLTEEQLEDTAFMAAEISELVPQELAFALDDAIINGTGVGQPLGIMNAGSLVTQTKESGQTATTLNFANVAKMFGRIHSGSVRNSVWLINQDVFPHLLTMNSAATSAATPVYLPGGNIANAPFGTIFGRPVIPVEQTQTIGTVGDILLVDLSKYILVNKRTGIDQKSSMHVRFSEGETAYRFVMRVDGQPRWRSALTPKNSASTQSPFVALQTRS